MAGGNTYDKTGFNAKHIVAAGTARNRAINLFKPRHHKAIGIGVKKVTVVRQARLIRLPATGSWGKVLPMNFPAALGVFMHRLLIGLSSGFLCTAGGAETHAASAGWAEVEITPPLGISLGGRGSPETLAKKGSRSALRAGVLPEGWQRSRDGGGIV